ELLQERGQPGPGLREADLGPAAQPAAQGVEDQQGLLRRPLALLPDAQPLESQEDVRAVHDDGLLVQEEARYATGSRLHVCEGGPSTRPLLVRHGGLPTFARPSGRWY